MQNKKEYYKKTPMALLNGKTPNDIKDKRDKNFENNMIFNTDRIDF